MLINGNHAYTVVDLDSWDRKEHCECFRYLAEPVGFMTIELDITEFLAKIRDRNLSFTLCMTYASVKTAAEFEAFRYRFLDGQVVLFDGLDTRFSYLRPQDRFFRTISAPLADSMEEYAALAQEAIQTQKTTFPPSGRYDYIQTAPIPWVSYTSVTHTKTGTDEDSIPLFSWGKYFQRDGRMLMPFTQRMHHSFVDGEDLRRWLERLSDFMREC